MLDYIKNSLIRVIPSLYCNLDCPHCDQKAKAARYVPNEDKFIEVLKSIPKKSNSILLFGGEPLLNRRDYLLRLLNTNQFTSITSNLLLLDDEILKIIIEKNLGIGSSWNLKRMSEQQYQVWLDKLRMVKAAKRTLTIFITTTEDMIQNLDKLYQVMDDMDKIGVDVVSFNQYIPLYPKLAEMQDDFLCKIEKDWRWKIQFKNRNTIPSLNGHPPGCMTHSFTLYPDGTLDPNCQHTDGTTYHLDKFEECKTCPFKSVCQVCPRQPVCAFPKKFYLQVASKTLNKMNKDRIARIKANRQKKALANQNSKSLNNK